eukprot:scaffold9468_cov19-Tisochrysis_lutea.AAC.2
MSRMHTNKHHAGLSSSCQNERLLEQGIGWIFPINTGFSARHHSHSSCALSQADPPTLIPLRSLLKARTFTYSNLDPALIPTPFPLKKPQVPNMPVL